MKTKPSILVLISFLWLAVSCSSKNRLETDESSQPQSSIDHLKFWDVTPMLDGSAYARAADSSLWYLRSNKAVRVTVAGTKSQPLPRLDEITPVFDGSAYAPARTRRSSPAGGLWYLHREYAEKVTEGTLIVDGMDYRNASNSVFYALYRSEHKKRREAEERQADDDDSN